jgi:hypothetical protein
MEAYDGFKQQQDYHYFVPKETVFHRSYVRSVQCTQDRQNTVDYSTFSGQHGEGKLLAQQYCCFSMIQIHVLTSPWYLKES